MPKRMLLHKSGFIAKKTYCERNYGDMKLKVFPRYIWGRQVSTGISNRDNRKPARHDSKHYHVTSSKFKKKKKKFNP